MKALGACLLMLTLASSGHAATIHVPGDQPTIQAAIDIATPGDEIVLADGVFSGPGNSDLDYDGRAITIRSSSGNPALTTIQCDGTPGDPHRGFVFQSGEGADAVLEGVTVSGAFAPGLPESQGGGALCTNGSSPTFRTCVFSFNVAKFGGGVYCDSGTSPTFFSCEFVENHATDGAGLGQGGAVAFPGSTPSFAGCSFRGNVADLSAGAIWGGSPGEVEFSTCVFEGNQSQNAGGVGYISSGGVGSIRFVDCQFVDNYCTNQVGGGGGALSCFRVDVELTRCTFARNSGATGGALSFSDVDATASGCVFEENTANRSGGGAFINQDARMIFEQCAFFANEALGTHPNHGGGAVHSSTGTKTSFVGCLFVKNAAPNGGGVYRTQHSFLGLTNCTLVDQSGAAIGFFGSGQDTLRNTVIAFTAGPGITCSSNVLTVECCDLFGNAGGDGICGVDAGGNISADPLFCDAEDDDFHLQWGSPCLPANSNGCGLIGAYGFGGCNSISVTPETWGRIKAKFRQAARVESPEGTRREAVAD